MIEVHLYGKLKKLLPSDVLPLRLAANTPAEVIRALCVQIDGFEDALGEGYYRLKLDREPLCHESMLGFKFGNTKSLHIYPCAIAANPVSLIVGGIALIASVVALTSIPKIDDYTDREDSDNRASFLANGTVNARQQGSMVPLIYGGPIKVGGTQVSAGLTAERVAEFEEVDEASDTGGSGDFGGRQSPPRQPIEGENTLQTFVTARVVDVIGEGPIVGLVNEDKSIEVDGQQVRNNNGSLNLEGIHYDFRSGLPNQEPLDGFPDIESTQDFAPVEMTHNSRVTRSIESPTADSARLTFRWPRLSFTNDDGDTGVTSVRFRIEVSSGSGSFRTVLVETIEDKNSSPAELSYSIPLRGDGPFTVGATKLTEDSDSDLLHNRMFLQSVTEVSSIRQSYSNSAVIGIRASFDRFNGQINKREYTVKGRIIKVPSNYEPNSKQYSGLWDGTFKLAWTTNGAWAVYDVLINRLFGLGSRLPVERIEATKWVFYQLAQFNDGLVPDGKGGLETRFEFTGIINRPVEAKRLLDNMLAAFSAKSYYGGGAIVPIQDAPQDRRWVIGNDKVINGEFSYGDVVAYSDRVSVINISYYNPDNDFKLEPFPVIDNDLVRKYGYRESDVVAMFCTRRSEAIRKAKMLLFQQEYENETVEFSPSIEFGQMRPGQVVAISDRDESGFRAHVRVANYVRATGQLTVDSLDGINPVLNWRADIVLADGELINVQVIRIDGDTLTINTSLLVEPLPNASCLLTAPELEPKEFRLVSVDEIDLLEYRAMAVGYRDDKHGVVERGVTIDAPSYQLVPTGPLAAPGGVNIVEELYRDGLVSKSRLVVSVDTPTDARVAYYEYQIKRPVDSAFTRLDYVPRRTIEVNDVSNGSYRVRARFVSGLGANVSAWTESNIYEVTGKAIPANAPTNLSLSVDVGRGVVIKIDPITDFDLLDYSYYFGDNFDTAEEIIKDIKAPTHIWPNVPVGLHTVWVVWRDTSRNTSPPVSGVVVVDGNTNPVGVQAFDAVRSLTLNNSRSLQELEVQNLLTISDVFVGVNDELNAVEARAEIREDVLVLAEEQRALAVRNVGFEASIDEISAEVQDFTRAAIGYCTIDGSVSGELTIDACEAAGGTWVEAPLAEVVQNTNVTLPDGSTASVNQLAQAFQNDSGQLVARGGWLLDSQGRAAGIAGYSDGVLSQLDLVGGLIRLGDIKDGNYRPQIYYDASQEQFVVQAKLVLDDGRIINNSSDIEGLSPSGSRHEILYNTRDGVFPAGNLATADFRVAAGRGPIDGDLLTYTDYGAANPPFITVTPVVDTRRYFDGAWQAFQAIFNGNVLIRESLHASALQFDSATGNIFQANTITADKIKFDHNVFEESDDGDLVLSTGNQLAGIKRENLSFDAVGVIDLAVGGYAYADSQAGTYADFFAANPIYQTSPTNTLPIIQQYVVTAEKFPEDGNYFIDVGNAPIGSFGNAAECFTVLRIERQPGTLATHNGSANWVDVATYSSNRSMGSLAGVPRRIAQSVPLLKGYNYRFTVYGFLRHVETVSIDGVNQRGYSTNTIAILRVFRQT